MSRISLSGEPPLLNNAIESGSVHRICSFPEKGWERLWTWAADCINPIVVKEVRQSLKSRQFSISFGLTLIAAVTWTLLAVAFMVPRIYFVPGGAPLLAGFFCILQFPLMIIIPFSAFRSLTTETENSTFDLLSISALSAWQIVLGKMTSAMLQMLLYLSALAPCIALTYLMRGVSLYSIFLMLGITVMFCVAETSFALLLAAVSRSIIVQALSMVMLLSALIVGFIVWSVWVISGILSALPLPTKDTILIFIGIFTVIAIALELILRSAAAAIDFPSENHSTPLRRRILLLIGMILFWSTFSVVAGRDEDISYIFLYFAFFVCMFIAALMTGEYGIISPRARRSLPTTFAGRVFLTWFYPGAGMGYIFLVCLFAALVATICLTEIYYSYSMQMTMGRSNVQFVGFILLCYLTFYAGLNRLLMMAIGRQVAARMLVSFALMAVTVLGFNLAPWMLAFVLNDYREFDYDWHQAFNSVLTLGEAHDGLSVPLEASMAILTLASISIFGLNLILSTRDVMLVRMAEPPRVQDETRIATPVLVPDPFAE